MLQEYIKYELYLTNKQITIKTLNIKRKCKLLLILFYPQWLTHCHPVCFAWKKLTIFWSKYMCIKKAQDIICVISSTGTDKLLLLESGFVFNEGLSEECFHHPEKQDNEDCQCHVWSVDRTWELINLLLCYFRACLSKGLLSPSILQKWASCLSSLVR